MFVSTCIYPKDHSDWYKSNLSYVSSEDVKHGTCLRKKKDLDVDILLKDLIRFIVLFIYNQT